MQKQILVSLIGIFLSATVFAKENTPFNKKQQLHFLENNGQIKNEYGQIRNDIDYVLKGGGINVFLGAGKIRYQFSKTEIEEGSEVLNSPHHKTEMYTMGVELIGVNAHVIAIPEGKQDFVTRFYQVAPVAGKKLYTEEEGIVALSYSRVTYKNVYPEIDWVVYVKDGQLEYDFVVRPGGDPADIKLKYTGAVDIRLNQDGSIVSTTPMGTINENAPYAYQLDGKKVHSSFHLQNDELSFDIGDYEGTLVIDPVLTWSTYHGVAGVETYNAIELDGQGHVFVAGETTSTTNLVTDTTTYSGDYYDGFVSKFDTSGDLIWTTYWGTVEEDYLPDMTLDGNGNLYITGHMTGPDFGDGSDAYLAKLTTNGILVGNYYWESEFFDGIYAKSVVCDNDGNVFVGGHTNQTTGLATPGAYKTTMTGGTDALITKFDGGLNILWCTYFGGSSNDDISDMEIDNSGNLYVNGITRSWDFSTSGQILGGLADFYVAKFDIANEDLIWSTYIGGDEIEPGGGDIAVDTIGDGAVYMAAATGSTNNISTVGSYQPGIAGGPGDAFLIKLDTAGEKQWGTYFGGNQNEVIKGLSVDLSGVYALGMSSSTNLPILNGSQTVNNGGQFDGFFTKFSKNGSLIWSTYFGGTSFEYMEDIVTDYIGNFYFCGTSGSSGLSFNTTFQPNIASSMDAILGKFSDCSALSALGSIIGNATLCIGDVKTYAVPEVLNAGYSWTLSGGISGSSTSDSITITANSLGSATLTVLAYGYCDTTQAQSISITVNPLPVPTVTNNNNQLSTGTFASYQWNLNGSPIVGANSQDHTASAEGDYTVTVTDANGCTGTSAISPVGVAELNTNISSVLIVPNPNEGHFTISGYLPSANTKTEMEIIDVTGSVIYKTQLKVVNNQLNHPINLEQKIAAGTYYIKLTTDATTQVIRFVKR